MNQWLHREIMKRIAEAGGDIPPHLYQPGPGSGRQKKNG
jgi:hypothetical protein